MSVSSEPRSNYVGTVRARLSDSTMYYQSGVPLSTSHLVNDTGFVTPADSPHADWAQTDVTISSFIQNKPNLATVAVSGSASDLATGTLPVGVIPYLDCSQIATGVFPVGRLPTIPSGLVSGLAPIATSGNLWTGANVAALQGNTPTPVGAGGFVGWNRDGSSGLTVFSNNKGGFGPGGWEWVSYRGDTTFEGLAASLSSDGTLNVAKGLAVAGTPLAAVALSGSAADLTNGILPTSVLPQIPMNNISYGSFQADLIPNAPNQYNIGSSSAPWLNVWAKTIYLNGAPIHSVAASGSASDLTSGTLSSALLPSIDASQIGSGTFSVGSFGCDVTPNAASAYSLGTAALPWKNLTMTGTLAVGSSTLQPVALSGSATDLTAGVLPLPQVPALPASQLTSGTFSVGAFGCSVLPTAAGLSLGLPSSRWTNVNFTNGNFSGVLTGGSRTDRCQIGLAGSNLLPGSTSYFGFGVGTNGSSAPGTLEAHVDKASSDFVWYANATELLRLQGGGNLLPGATNTQCLGYFGNQFQFVFANQFWRNGSPLADVCTSGSASDLKTGTLPLAQVPALIPDRMSLPGSFSIDLVPATANSLRVGTPASPWGTVFAQQIYRNGTPLAAVATSAAWSDMAQPVAIQGTPSLNVVSPGFYFAYGRTAGSGTTTFASQRGSGTQGGFEFLSYSASNAAESGPLLSVDCQGNTSVGGALTGMGSGGLLMRSWDESAPNTAGSTIHRFQGKPIACALLASLNLANFAVGPFGQTSSFACRVSGYMQPPLADTYTFKVTFDDAVRVWVNNLKVVDSWSAPATSPTTATFTASLGTQPIPVMIEYYQTTGNSALQVQWKGASNNTSYQTLTHGDFRGGSAMSLYYDMYENPPSQLGTTWANGPLYANLITNNGSGVQIPDKVDFGSNGLYGVSFLNNKGSPIGVGDALALSSKPMYGASAVGVGTSSPAVALDVFGAAANGQVHITASDLGEASIGFGAASNNATFNSSNCWVVGRGAWSSGNNMAFGAQGTGGIMYITPGSSPSVGINQATPQYTLDVTGTGRFTGTLYAPQIVTNTVTTNSNNNSFGNTLYVTQGTGVSILKSTASCALDVVGDTAVSGKVTAGSVIAPKLNADGSPLAIGNSLFLTGGSTPMIGVMQSSPQYALDVTGTVRASKQSIAAEVVTGSLNTTSPQPLSINNVVTVTTGSAPKVGILQTNPAYALDVTGDMRASSSLTTNQLTVSNVVAPTSALTIANYVSIWGGSNSAPPYVAINQNNPAYNFDTAGTGRFTQALYANTSVTTPAINPGAAACTISNTIFATGGSVPKVGINKSAPAATCDIAGTLAVSGASTMAGDVAAPSVNAAGGKLSIGNFLFFTGGNNPALGIVQTNPQYTLDVTGNCNVTGPMYAYSIISPTISPPGSSMTIGGSIYLKAGNWGVNQASPAYSWDVTGSARVTGTAILGGVTTATVNPPSGGTLALGNGIFVGASAVGVFTSTPQTTFDVNGAARFSTSVTAGGLETPVINASLNKLSIGSLLTLTAGSSAQLGVGTSSPGATLDVVGSMRVSGATTYGSIQTSTINGDGSTIHIGNAIHFIGGNTPMVGILQPSPQYTLDVSGGFRATGGVIGASLTTPTIGNSGNGLALTEAVTANSLSTPLLNDSQASLRIAQTVWVNGNQVGIMQSSPSYTLDVSGNGRITGNLAVGGLTTPTINGDNSKVQIGTQLVLTGSKVGVFNMNPSATLDVAGTFACSGGATLGSLVTPTLNGDGSAVTISKSLTCTGGSSPKIGVLTSSPAVELDVVGNCNVSLTTTTKYLTAVQFNQGGQALTVGSTMWFTGGSNPMVGILQKNPQYTLDVAGNSQITGTLTTGAVLAVGSALAVGSVITCVPGSSSVGINRPSPQYTLDVNGNASISGNTLMGGVQTSNINAGGQALTVGLPATPGIYVSGGSSPKVGILQGSPAFTLDVTGDARATSSVITPVVNGAGQALAMSKTVWLTGNPSNSSNPRVGILTSSPNTVLDVRGDGFFQSSVTSTGVITPYIALAGQSGHVFDITTNGVGLYQGTPQYSFDVTGNVRATSGVNTPVVTAPSDSLQLGSNVYAKGGRLGVFQPSPGSGAVPSSMPSGTTLDVAGAVRFLGTTGQLCFMQSQTGSSGNAYLAVGDAVSTNNAAWLQYNNNGGAGSSSNSVYLGLYPTQNLTLTSGGVGVFQTNPLYPLDVGGSANVSQTLSAGGVNTPAVGSSSNLSLMPASSSNTVSVGGSTSFPTLTVVNNMLGVATSNPQYTLDVSGNGRVTGQLSAGGLAMGSNMSFPDNGSGITWTSGSTTTSTITSNNSALTVAASTFNLNDQGGTRYLWLTNSTLLLSRGVTVPFQQVVDCQNGSSVNNDSGYTPTSTSPQVRLSYGSTCPHTIASRHNSNADNGNAIDFYTWSKTNDSNVSNQGSTRMMSVTTTGVGVNGVTNPQYSLDVQGNLNLTSGALYYNGVQTTFVSNPMTSDLNANNYSITNCTQLFTSLIHFNGSNGTCYGNVNFTDTIGGYGGGDVKMTGVNCAGNCTVGSALYVNGSFRRDNGQTMVYCAGYNDAGWHKGFNIHENISIQTSNALTLGGPIFVFSDERLKTDISRRAGAEDLGVVAALSNTTYSRRDYLEQGNRHKIGFIAQEVQRAAPAAVSASSGFIPNVYRWGEIGEVTGLRCRVLLDCRGRLGAGDRVQYGSGTSLHEAVVMAVDNDSVELQSDSSPAPWARQEGLWIVGKFVDDVLTVDYNQITATCVGAIQELSARISETRRGFAALEARVRELETKCG